MSQDSSNHNGYKKLSETENDYQSRRHNRILSPTRHDPFALKAIPNQESRNFTDTMLEASINAEMDSIMMEARERKIQGENMADDEVKRQKRAKQWDEDEQVKENSNSSSTSMQRRSRWDLTPVASSSKWDLTPAASRSSSIERPSSNENQALEFDKPPFKTTSRWDMTPVAVSSSTVRGSRWDETPVSMLSSEMGTPLVTLGNETPVGMFGMVTPLPGYAQTPEQISAIRWERELDSRNKPLSDEDLDSLLPLDGYAILEAPSDYVPLMTPSRKLTQTPARESDSGFMFQSEEEQTISFRKSMLDIPTGDLPFIKEEDYQYFGKLLSKDVDEASLSMEEAKERKIMALLLKIKNGNPQMRRIALKQITDKAVELGASALFNQILPLLMSPSLDEQERHLLVKVLDRILFRLDDAVRPYVHKILIVIEPMLIDQDYYARAEGREVISSLTKAAGLPTLISVMRPDIDNPDEFVRNTTARAFAVIAGAVGIPAILPFLKAVVASKKSWQARHTGIKIIQQIAILHGVAVLPHLKSLVEIMEPCLADEQYKVITMTALSLAALAEASSPFGIESFETVLKPLWKGIRQHRGKTLAAFLKAVGLIIPLMDSQYAKHYTIEIMGTVVREFSSNDDEMKKIVLKVLKQTANIEGITGAYIKAEILPDFFRYFWVRRLALDNRNLRAVVETTVELSKKTGLSSMLNPILNDLKDDSEPYRKMVAEAIDKMISTLSASDIDSNQEKILIDGFLHAYQAGTPGNDALVLNAFGNVLYNLGTRAKQHLQQIVSSILWRLNNQSPKIRQQAADLAAKIVPVIGLCGEEKMILNLGKVLFEYLGEEYPDVLGSLLGAFKAVVNVAGINQMNPPMKDVLPRLTPILKNRHDKVQEYVIDLMGKIAERAPECVSAREWLRICFELLEVLRSPKKSIRRSAVVTFGFIARAIGPADVLATLLSNLKVQERQNRICTTIAIAIIAENCSPFTVLPALMNEYRVPELNVQNGVLKALAFTSEYIGELNKDYIYAITPLLEDALIDRDLVHRQISCSVVKHLSVGVYGFGCDDALLHLLNLVWPNIFETSPHLVQTFFDAIDGLRLSLGSGVLLMYTLQGLFHPARKVRDVFWRVYNMLYIGGQPGMVPFYPRLSCINYPSTSSVLTPMNEMMNQYFSSELELFI